MRSLELHNGIDWALYLICAVGFWGALLSGNQDAYSLTVMVCCILIMGGARIRIEIRNLRKDAILRNEAKQ